MGIYRKGFQDMFQRNKWKILRGDKVQIMAGRDAGQVGTVLKVIRDSKFPRVVVEGQNLNKRHIKRTKDNPGGIVSVESPLHYSNVQLVDPVTNGPVRSTWRYLEDGTKVRVTKGRLSSGSVVPRPDVLKQRRKPRPSSSGPADTLLLDAQETTHTPGDLPSFLKQAAQQQQQQRRQHHWAAAAAAAAAGSSSSSSIGAAVARLLGSRLQPLSSGLAGSGSRGFWRGFAASPLWW